MDNIGPVQQLAEATLVGNSIKLYGKGKFMLAGEDGNAFAIMSRVSRALKKAGWSLRAVTLVTEDMKADNYNHLLRVAMGLQDPRWVELEDMAAELDLRRRELEDE